MSFTDDDLLKLANDDDIDNQNVQKMATISKLRGLFGSEVRVGSILENQYMDEQSNEDSKELQLEMGKQMESFRGFRFKPELSIKKEILDIITDAYLNLDVDLLQLSTHEQLGQSSEQGESVLHPETERSSLSGRRSHDENRQLNSIKEDRESSPRNEYSP